MDIGVRVEVRNEIMETVNEVLYESKLIGYPAPFKNKVRTFCQNPGGFVSQENYDNGLAVVNGHSFKEVKSPNTNLSILCSHNFSVLKFYSNRVKMDADLNTNIRRLHCLGDSSGWTRGLMMASVMGVLMGREIIRQENI